MRFSSIVLGVFALSVVAQPLSAQTTDFATIEKTVTLPKGSKIDPKFLLRRKKVAETESTETTEPVNQEEENKRKLSAELDGQLLGAWVRVASVSDKLSDAAVRNAARRCIEPLKLKPLRFETTAAQKLPDIDGLFGDLVYYRTEKGLQRLDIKLGHIRYIQQIELLNVDQTKKVWRLLGRNLVIRIRFAKRLPKLPKARFMLEESGFYLRCPSDKDDVFNVDQ